MTQDQHRIKRIRLTDTADIDEAVRQTAAVLSDGGVVLTPTDTVYGLVCLLGSLEAVETIFAMKQRPSGWRLPVIVADLSQAENDLPLIWNDAARILARTYWPGTLTIACGVQKNVEGLLEGRVEAAIRAPKYLFIQTLARTLGPLLMTSANRHGDDTPHTMEGALMVLTTPPALAIDGGLLNGAPSTLVNVNLPVPVIERVGVIPANEIEEVLKNA